jgi:NADH:ubiquinone oxidoreductase subunit 6 (subunit J)
VHFISATIFFLTLAVMSLFLFTISTKPTMTDEKRNRNKVYIACGVTMVVCIVLIAAGKFFMTREWNEQTSFMFWLESIAVVAFGISWLTKAEVILADSVTT